MSFANEFTPVWEEAIVPAVEECLEGGKKYKAHRVDITTLSGSIITEILDGVAHATLIFADISVMSTGEWRGQRNGNVMYEVGLAHAVRPDTDIALVRSDRKRINFDVSGIRVKHYPKNDLSQARKIFANLLNNALHERNKTMSLIIERARVRLDLHCLKLMTDYGEKVGFRPFVLPKDAPLEDRMAIWRLLDLEIITCVIPKHLHYEYRWTDFGKAAYWKPNLVPIHDESDPPHPYPTQDYSDLNRHESNA